MKLNKQNTTFLQAASLLISLIIFVGQQLMAEGTRELIPQGAASDCISYIQGNDNLPEGGKEGSTFGRPATDWIYVHIDDPTKETIYYGFTRKEPLNFNLYYKIVAPDGTIACSGQVANNITEPGYIADDGIAAYEGPMQIAGGSGYSAIECVPTMAGDYAILFNVGDPVNPANLGVRYFVHPFDVTVADVSNPSSPKAIDGRLFSYRWHLNTNSQTNKACMQFYTFTQDSMVVAMDMNEIQAHGYTVSFNSFGTQNTGNVAEDRKSIEANNANVPEYPVFLNDPDPVAYPEGIPGTVSNLDFNGCPDIMDFCIKVNVTQTSELNVYISLDGVAGYQPGGKDVYFPFKLNQIGEVCIPWDGIDGEGNPVAAGDAGEVTVEFLAGVVHYPVWDAENHLQGFNASIVRPEGLPAPKLFYDNTNFADLNTQNLEGCSSGCNTWDNNKGNIRLINTWINAIISMDTRPFTISSFCPPVPQNDSTCAFPDPNIGIQIAILANDQDPDGNLDPASVTLFGLNPAEGLAAYEPATQLVSFLPAEGFVGTCEFFYEVCDFTAVANGGPLCRTAMITIEVDPTCDNQNTFPVELQDFQVKRIGNDAQLNWITSAELNSDRFEIERSFDGSSYHAVGSVQAAGTTEDVQHYSFEDRDVVYAQTKVVYYRLKQVDFDGAFEYSDAVALQLGQDIGIIMQVYPNPAVDQLNLQFVSDKTDGDLLLRILSPEGKSIITKKIDTTSGGLQQLRFSVEGWTSGVYYVQLLTESYATTKKIVVM